MQNRLRKSVCSSLLCIKRQNTISIPTKKQIDWPHLCLYRKYVLPSPRGTLLRNPSAFSLPFDEQVIVLVMNLYVLFFQLLQGEIPSTAHLGGALFGLSFARQLKGRFWSLAMKNQQFKMFMACYWDNTTDNIKKIPDIWIFM